MPVVFPARCDGCDINKSLDTQLKWQQNPDDDFVWSACGDGFVIYHRPSGKTHLLNDASCRLLRDLLQEPMDLAAIAAEFEPGQDGSQSDDYLERMASMLRRLEQLGLIQRA